MTRQYDSNEDPARVRFPFGKFRGDPVNSVPSSYLCWCIEECENLRLPLRRTIQHELASRFGFHAQPATSRPALPTPEVAVAAGELVALGYRALALKAHPDRGGSHNAMIAATDARDWLRGVLGAA